MNSTITISTPEVALFDRTYLESMIRTFIKTLAQSVQTQEDELPVLSAAELANTCSVDDAEQEILNIVHNHFHPSK